TSAPRRTSRATWRSSSSAAAAVRRTTPTSGGPMMETLVASRNEAETLALVARLARVELPRRPRLAPWVTPVELGDGRLQLRGAELAATLRHPFLVDVYRAIEPLLDGRH